MSRRLLFLFLLVSLTTIIIACKTLQNPPISKNYQWTKLETESFRGKQDDIAFIDENIGWYINGIGRIFNTSDGGNTWKMQLEQKGTFFRTVAFLDKNIGFAGTVGTDYYPNVLDTIPLYGTKDGGNTWSPVDYEGPYVKGLCGMDIVKEPFIYQGETQYKNHIFAVGRVGSPANFMVSHDNGETWTSKSMTENCAMMFDIKMFNKNEGFACASSSADMTKGNALILQTTDGGDTWNKVYQSKRPYENVWKMSFPTRKVGFATIQNYDPDTTLTIQRVVRTNDGGKTWKELDLVDDKKARPFGIGFINEKHGFVGTMNSGYETKDSGKTWSPINMGRACNKIRIHQTKTGKTYGYAIGVDVYKLKEE